MKEYKIGDSICFRDVGGTSTWGRVTAVNFAFGSFDLRGYDVQPGGRISLDQVIDLEQISADAGAALDRIHAEARRKADLLYELLGELSFYGDRKGQIDYYTSYRHEETVKVADLVTKYRLRAEGEYNESTHSRDLQCRCGYPKRDEPHTHWAEVK